jgi:hypothetical protein
MSASPSVRLAVDMRKGGAAAAAAAAG